MYIANFAVLLALSPPAQPGQEQPPIYMQMMPLLVLIFVFYFILIRPQAKQAKQQDEMRKNLQKGDRVVTNGGVVGTVVAIREKENSLVIRSDETKLEVLKTAVTSVADKNTATKS
jgi:preprotein translocase subunit YajC